MNKIILASKSEVRKKILLENGISCNVEPSKVDEDVIKESLLKAFYSIESDNFGLDISHELLNIKDENLKNLLTKQRPDRLLIVAEAIRRKIPLTEINELTYIDMFFLREISELIKIEQGYYKKLYKLQLNKEKIN